MLLFFGRIVLLCGCALLRLSCALPLSFAFPRFAAFLRLVGSALFGSQMTGRLDTLFAQALVLDLLLMLNHPLFLFAHECFHLLWRQAFVF